MSKQNQISEKMEKKPDLRLHKCLAYELLLEKVREKTLSKSLDQSIKAFQEERDSIHKKLTDFWKTTSQTELLVVFLDWLKEQRSYDLVMENAKILLENELIPFYDAKKVPIKLCSLTSEKLSKQIDAIRCQRKFPIYQREELVDTFVNFLRWLSIHTVSYMPEFEDPDKQRTDDRLISHDVFIRLLGLLDERCCIIAKLLYFGGNRTLEQVVSLDIQNVDFKHSRISMQGNWIDYPSHILDDLKTLVGERREGPVFLGRNNTRINPSTIFRNFKVIGPSLGILELSPKMLTDSRK
jgi:hypothetical protein